MSYTVVIKKAELLVFPSPMPLEIGNPCAIYPIIKEVVNRTKGQFLYWKLKNYPLWPWKTAATNKIKMSPECWLSNRKMYEYRLET